jgi:hypothetical protein
MLYVGLSSSVRFVICFQELEDFNYMKELREHTPKGTLKLSPQTRI